MPTTFQSRTEFHKSVLATEDSTTDGWDVVVSYREAKLNPLLKKYWTDIVGPTTIKFDYSSGDEEYDYVSHFQLTLDSPIFAFGSVETTHGAIASSILRWNITGSVHVVSNSEADLGTKSITKEDGVSLTANTPVSAMKGEATDVKDSKPSDTTFHFEDGVQSSYRVILHFENSPDSDWKVDTTNPNSKHYQQLKGSVKHMVSALKDTENVKNFSFTLGEVTNKYTPGDDFLTPQNFRFNAVEGVLSIFIKVKGGSGQEEYEANIILSKSLIQNNYLIPKIQAKCQDFLRSSDGVVARSGTGPSVGLKFKDDKIWQHTQHGGGMVNTEGEISIKWDDHPLILTLFDDDSTLTSHYKWEWKDAVVTLKWTDRDVVHNPFPTWREETTKANIKDNSAPIATVSGDTLKFELAFTDNNQPEGASFKNIGVANLSGSVVFKTFSLSLPDLDFFRTQNVLAPGQHFIKAKDTMCPTDLFILGSMYD